MCIERSLAVQRVQPLRRLRISKSHAILGHCRGPVQRFETTPGYSRLGVRLRTASRAARLASAPNHPTASSSLRFPSTSGVKSITMFARNALRSGSALGAMRNIASKNTTVRHPPENLLLQHCPRAYWLANSRFCSEPRVLHRRPVLLLLHGRPLPLLLPLLWRSDPARSTTTPTDGMHTP